MGDKEVRRGMVELNLGLYNPDLVEGAWDIPVIRNDHYLPKGELRGFNYVPSEYKTDEKAYDKCVHFYVDDIHFQRIWNRPDNYINMLRKYEGILSPDFSLYLDMPAALKIYNTYRNRLIGQFMQRHGIKVIPTISWAGEDTYGYCFDGIEENAVVSVGTTGVVGRKERTELWRKGMQELLVRKKPRTILIYGTPIPFDSGNTEVLHYANAQIVRFKNLYAENRRGRFQLIKGQHGVEVPKEESKERLSGICEVI